MQNSNFAYCYDLLHFAYYCDDAEVLVSSCSRSTQLAKTNKKIEMPPSWSLLLPPLNVSLQRSKVRENTLLV